MLPAVFCEDLRFPAVFCENLRLRNAVIFRRSENLRKKCEFGSVFVPFSLSLLIPLDIIGRLIFIHRQCWEVLLFLAAVYKNPVP